MKKILNIFLAVALVLGCFHLSFADEVNTEPSVASAAELLRVLDIVNIDDSAVNQNVTRQEFAKIVYKLVTNLQISPGIQEACVFQDVTDEEFIPYINRLYELKIINGYSDGKFKPEKEISVIEAIVFTVRALSYDVFAEANGGYPGGYLLTARNMGLLKNVNSFSNDMLTYRDVAFLVKNALTSEMRIRDVYGDNGNVSFSGETTTLLYSVFKVCEIEAVVDGIDITMLSGESSVPPYCISIGGKLLDSGKLNPRKYLGYSVTAYYTYEDDVLIHIEEAENKIEVMNISDIVSISDNKIAKEIGGKTKYISYDKLADFIYNMGATQTPLNLELFEDKEGTLTLIDNNCDNKVDVIKADVYYDMVVDYVNTSEQKAYDSKTGEWVSIDNTNDNPFVSLEGSEGGTFNQKDIKKNDILTVYKTLSDSDQQYTRIVRNTAQASGIVAELGNDENGKLVAYIDDEPYTFTGVAERRYASEVNVGEFAKLLLNYEGKVAGVAQYAEGKMKFGMLLKCQAVTEGIEKVLYAKVFSTSNEALVLNFKDNVRIDGIEYDEADETILKHLRCASDVVTGTSNKKRYMQLIKYSLDDNGKLEYIDTVLKSYDKASDSGVKMTVSDEGDTYNSLIRGYSSGNSAATFGWGAQFYRNGNEYTMVNSNTVVFNVPTVNSSEENCADEKYYSYKGTGAIDGYDRIYTAYFSSPENMHASVITHHFSSGVDEATSVFYYVFDKYTYASREGIPYLKIYYWLNGAYNTVYAEASAEWIDSTGLVGPAGKKYRLTDLKEGDAIILTRNNEGIVSDFRLYARAEGDIKVGSDVYPNSYTARGRRVSGYLYKLFNDGASFVLTDDKNAIESAVTYEYLRDNTTVLVYDSSKREGHRLYTESLKSGNFYTSDGKDCSRVYINQNAAVVYSIYIVR